ncbi:MAG: hypothetical protein C5B50_27475 [Verrucomicrobia bacterium]|nr:MAG: hypothetical protein C5B50_27475 [Verrucomicrobiota bacterium]
MKAAELRKGVFPSGAGTGRRFWSALPMHRKRFRTRSAAKEKRQRTGALQDASRFRAFSLIEVLCAMLILGVALVGLTEAITVALHSSKDSELQSTAAMIAAGQLETLRAQGGLENGETQGDCTEGLSLYRWKQTITGAGIDGLHEVAVVVENAKSGQSIYELRTLLFEAPDEPLSSSSGKGRDSKGRKRREG